MIYLFPVPFLSAHRPAAKHPGGLARDDLAFVSADRHIEAKVGRMSGRVVLPPDQYVASLARKRMAAGALFRDEAGGVLLVNPVYKPTWDLPGGAVEAEESPHAECVSGGL